MVNLDRFQFYTDYYAFATEAGLDRARSLFPAINTTLRLDTSSVGIPRESIPALKNLSRMLDLAYESVWTDGQDRIPIREALDGLSAYVLESASQTIDAYLTANQLKVEPFYAKIERQINDGIVSDSNIKT